MKIKKITLLLFLVFFICGCTAKYDLDIKETSFTENLEISAASNETLYKYYIKTTGKTDFYDIENDFQTKKDGEVYYDVNLVKENNVDKLKYNYEFMGQDLSQSNFINSSFTNVSFGNNDSIIDTSTKHLLLSDFNGFTLFKKLTEVEININCPYEVTSNNADKVKNNTYTWIINKDNMKNASIELVYNEGVKVKPKADNINNIINTCLIAIGGIVVLGAIIIGIKVLKSNK